MKFWKIALLFITSVIAGEQNPFYPDYVFHLGSKTPYRIVANTRAKEIFFKGCRPEKLWMIMRHGTRKPSRDFIIHMNTDLVNLRNAVISYLKAYKSSNETEDLVNSFQEWNSYVNHTLSKHLEYEGEEEMVLLAERMQNRFPSLLTKIYSSTWYYFKHTSTQRTKESAINFAKGLFGKQTSKDVWYIQSVKNDPVTQFYKLCRRWQKQVKKADAPLAQRQRFKEAFGPQIVNALKTTWGWKDLTYDDVELMYLTCGFETAWHKYKTSPWCKIFSLDILKKMEFSEDLKYFWVDGYGYEITYKQACISFKDMIDFFESPLPYPKVKLFFAHSGTLLKLMTHLGLYNDSKPLLYTDYQKDDRLWRVSKIDTFATNLAFVLYDCKGVGRKVLLLHQEEIVLIPGCLKKGLCDIKLVKDNFYDSIYHCNFDQMCGNSPRLQVS